MFFLLSFLSLASFHLVSAISLPGIDIDTFLTVHNNIRAVHEAPALKWSTDLASMAANWVGNCVFAVTEGVLRDAPYGELHAAATGVFPIDTAINQFVRSEGKVYFTTYFAVPENIHCPTPLGDYDPANPTYNHFTQIVWKSTTQVGCAIAHCKDLLGSNTGLATYHACLYDPPGNIIGLAP